MKNVDSKGGNQEKRTYIELLKGLRDEEYEK